jgi:hypothetical protein
VQPALLPDVVNHHIDGSPRKRAVRKASRGVQAPTTTKAMSRQSKFPSGWDEERVHRLLAHYEEQTEEEAVAEDEAAFEDQSQTFIGVPNDLLPEVRRLLSRHRAS